ncbi:hypothetical protein K458DRAFT_396554 [Lentithecium fluviatile CBS 122367]|uniref:F-box domain-containing protein n=1 Tax=Lentithecium fluviatile CBS 122367 TaxID=1168545 RepID=A0A6G1IFL5_9PLEO|nr:hypothetical protein K458DRAFT_396554 [Lentithecium fluviatile CBS 122367]
MLDAPTVITENIAAHLDHEDILNFRLVSHALRDRSLHAFAQRCFENVFLFLQPDALHDLEEIARHPKFAASVQKLTVSNDRIHAAIKPPAAEVVLEKCFAEIAMAQVDSDWDVTILTEVLSLLRNLKTV